MDNICIILFLITFVLFFLNLIKPTYLSYIIKNPSRKKGSFIFGVTALFFFILIGVFSKSNHSQNKINNLNVIASNTSIITATTSKKIAIKTTTTVQKFDINKSTNKKLVNGLKKGPYFVTNVIDGDTIDVNIDGKKEALRLIGIDTPETVDPRKPVQCFGKEASNETKKLLNGKYVYLENDVLCGERGKYGRLLRYVFLEDGTNFNEFMIREGFAHEYTYNSIVYKYQSDFKQAEKEARENKRGLWADNICENKNNLQKIISVSVPTSSSASESTFVSTTKSTSVKTIQKNNSDCSCAGDLYNCDDFKTHIGAQLCYEKCGGINNDVHRLDRDKNSLACESLP